MGGHADLAGGRLTIDLSALTANWRQLAEKSRPAECGAVVKANAYGCGIEPVTEALAQAGCKTFFVALAEEGKRVRDVAPDARCFVLNGLFADAAPYLLENNLTPVLGSMPEIARWAAFAEQMGRSLPSAIQMDSGMNRLGISAEEFERLAEDTATLKMIDPQLLMTHYACADDVNNPKTEKQKNAFVQLAENLPNLPRSAANSAAILQENDHEFDLTRPGIALYGGEALNDVANPMQPVVTLEGRIMQIRSVKKGDGVGYGATEIMQRDSRIAYISIGYADGYHRGGSNAGVPMSAVSPPAKAAFNGHILNGVGRISMDMCAFDVTDIPENGIAAGDWIELFGKTISVDDVARASGTIGYELLTGLGNRYAKTYLKADD